MPDSEAPSNPPKPRPWRPPSPLGVITAALGIFLVVLTLLAIQVRSGRDPALGPGLVRPAAISQPATGKGGTAAQAQATSIVTRTSPVPPP
jgi:hypothetical protein